MSMVSYQRAYREGSPLAEGWRLALEHQGFGPDDFAWLERTALQSTAEFVDECWRAAHPEPPWALERSRA